jgi:hypothetical protein
MKDEKEKQLLKDVEDLKNHMSKLENGFTELMADVGFMKNHYTHPPQMNQFLSFIRESKVTSRSGLIDEFGYNAVAGSISRLNSILKGSQDFVLLRGVNRNVTAVYGYDDGSKNDPKVLILRFYLGMKMRQEVPAKRLVEELATQLEGDIDKAKQVAKAMFSPEIRAIMKGRLQFTRDDSAFKKVA